MSSNIYNTPSRDVARCAFTVSEFCQAHRISRSKLYSEWKAGRGPKTKQVGVKIIITVEAAAEWRAAEQTPVAA
jgi:hypothetical protein